MTIRIVKQEIKMSESRLKALIEDELRALNSKIEGQVKGLDVKIDYAYPVYDTLGDPALKCNVTIHMGENL